MIRKYTFLILTVILSILLTSCRSDINEALSGGKNADPELSQIDGSEPVIDNPEDNDLLSVRIPINEIIDNYSSDQDTLRHKTYTNIRFDNCTFKDLPDFDSVDVLIQGYHPITAEDSVNCIRKWLELNNLTVDLDKELRAALNDDYPQDESKEFPYFYPSVMEHYPNLSNGNGFFISCKDCHIQMMTKLIYSASNGVINKYAFSDSNRSDFDALGVHFDFDNIIAEGYVSEHGSDTYTILDGTMRLDQIADNLIEEITKTESIVGIDDKLTYDTEKFYVCKIGDVNQICFTLRRVYNGIPFAYSYDDEHIMDGGEQRGYYEYADGGHMYTIDGHLDAFVAHGLPNSYESKYGQQTDIISVARAGDILSEYLSDKVDLDIHDSEILYFPLKKLDSNGIETNQTIIHPCWMFDGKNSSDGKYMRCFVDSITGEIFYYVYGIEDHD